MKIAVTLKGRLGNQLFQYAFGYSISKKNNQPLKSNILCNYRLDLFNINEDFITKKQVYMLKFKKTIAFKILRKLLKWSRILLKHNYVYLEKEDFCFDEEVFDIKGNVLFDGYWQNEKYFKEYRSELLKQFTLKNEIHPETKKYQQKINNSNSVSLHIRRGDYISNKVFNEIFNVCSLDYYKNAVFKISEQIDNPHFFIFSDDLDWAKDNLDFINNKTFIEFDKNNLDYEELFLMSQCRHNIIANSSFSWWGAWLNQNMDKQVIAPQKWTNDTRNTSDIIPNTWIRLSTTIKNL